MARAMYFESNRSSGEGMLAVGTVVMNRMQSGRYPRSACGVVGQPNQFAQGVLSKPVSGRSWALALQTADSVLAGRRHPQVAQAMHFHTAGYTFPYRNMAYVVAAGGNVFYEKRTPGTFTPINPNVLVARATEPRPSERILLARAEEASPRGDLIHLASLSTNHKPRAPQSEMPRRALPSPAVAVGREPMPPKHEEKPASAKVGSGRTSLARLAEGRPGLQSHPAADGRPERVRLAQLDDDVLPRHGRSRTDAAAAPHGFDRPTRSSPLRAETVKPPPSVGGRDAKPRRDAGIPLAYKDVPGPKAGTPALPPAKPLPHGAAKVSKGGLAKDSTAKKKG